MGELKVGILRKDTYIHLASGISYHVAKGTIVTVKSFSKAELEFKGYPFKVFKIPFSRYQTVDNEEVETWVERGWKVEKKLNDNKTKISKTENAYFLDFMGETHRIVFPDGIPPVPYPLSML